MSKHVKTVRLYTGATLEYRLEAENAKFFISISESYDDEGTVSSKKERIPVKNLRRAKAFFKILYKNDVFPCHLNDVIRELLC